MREIPWEFQHAVVVAHIDKMKIRKVMRKSYVERRKTNFLDDEIVKIFKEKVIELVDVGVPNFVWTS